MKSINERISYLEMSVDNIDERVQTHDERLTQIIPVVKQAAHKNVVVWIAVVITILNLIILILNE